SLDRRGARGSPSVPLSRPVPIRSVSRVGFLVFSSSLTCSLLRRPPPRGATTSITRDEESGWFSNVASWCRRAAAGRERALETEGTGQEEDGAGARDGFRWTRRLDGRSIRRAVRRRSRE